jgi:hypothetical protein
MHWAVQVLLVFATIEVVFNIWSIHDHIHEIVNYTSGKHVYRIKYKNGDFVWGLLDADTDTTRGPAWEEDFIDERQGDGDAGPDSDGGAD